MSKRQGDCCCLALYGWSRPIDLAKWGDFALSFFEAVGIQPDTGALGGESRQVVDIDRVLTRLRKSDFSTKNGVSLYTTIPNLPDSKPMLFRWSAFADVSASPNQFMLFCFAADEKSLGAFERLLPQLLEVVTPKYGIGYVRDFKKGPDLFAYGMTSGLGYSDAEMEEKDRIAAWFHQTPEERTARLRDIFPMNILSRPLLNLPVNGATLQNWIDRAPERGTLTEIKNDVWLWKVESENIPANRTKLIAQELISCP